MNYAVAKDYYRQCASAMEYAYNVMKSHFDVDKSIDELMQIRGYVRGEEQEDLLTDMQICSCKITDVSELGSMADELGLLSKTKSGNIKDSYFLLNNRFIIPIRDIIGNIVAFVGYYPDFKKYITTPSPFFSKECLFFNMDDAYRRSFAEYNGMVLLVEGMFDCLSLRSIGLPAIATMGSSVSRMKCEVLKVFKKVIYIPDNDKVGRRALNRFDKVNGWNVPRTSVGIKLKGSFPMVDSDGKEVIMHVKDTDNLVSWYDADDIVEFFMDASRSNSIYLNLEV